MTFFGAQLAAKITGERIVVNTISRTSAKYQIQQQSSSSLGIGAFFLFDRVANNMVALTATLSQSGHPPRSLRQAFSFGQNLDVTDNIETLKHHCGSHRC